MVSDDPVAVRLRELMRAKGVPVSAVATACGVSQRQVKRWKAGDTPLPEAHVSTVAALLEVAPAELVQADATQAEFEAIQAVADERLETILELQRRLAERLAERRAPLDLPKPGSAEHQRREQQRRRNG